MGHAIGQPAELRMSQTATRNVRPAECGNSHRAVMHSQRARSDVAEMRVHETREMREMREMRDAREMR